MRFHSYIRCQTDHMTTPEAAPRLPGWLTPTEASDLLGVSRQTINKMIQAGEFASLHKIGPASRPQYVISADEVEHIRSNRPFPRSPRSRN